MIFNAAGLLKGDVGDTREMSFSESRQLDPTAPLTLPVQGRVKFTRTNQGILAQGSVETEVELPCSRCLVPTHVPVELTFEEEFYPIVDVNTGAPVKPMENDLAFLINKAHEIDLSEAIRQNLLVALPIAPYCKPTCKGLCPICGNDLNEGPCECQQETDLRWQALKDLLPKG